MFAVFADRWHWRVCLTGSQQDVGQWCASRPRPRVDEHRYTGVQVTHYLHKSVPSVLRFMNAHHVWRTAWEVQVPPARSPAQGMRRE